MVSSSFLGWGSVRKLLVTSGIMIKKMPEAKLQIILIALVQFQKRLR